MNRAILQSLKTFVLLILTLAGGGCLDSFSTCTCPGPCSQQNQSDIKWNPVPSTDKRPHLAGREVLAIENEFLAFAKNRQRMTSYELEKQRTESDSHPLDFGVTLVGRELNLALFLEDATTKGDHIQLRFRARSPTAIERRESVTYSSVYNSRVSSGVVTSMRLCDSWSFKALVPLERGDEVARLKRLQPVWMAAKIIRAEGLKLDDKTRGINAGRRVRFTIDPMGPLDQSPIAPMSRAVIIVDRSGSMTEHWEAALSIVERTIWGLLPQDRFCVVLGDSWRTRASQLRPAHFDNQWEVIQDSRQIVCEGQSYFRSDLRTAAAKSPTDIYIVSDFDANIGEFMFIQNTISDGIQAGVRFHLFEMGDGSSRASEILTQLKDQVARNGGTYEQIDSTDLEVVHTERSNRSALSIENAIFTAVILFGLMT